MRKVRPDSKLQTLPEGQQEALSKFLENNNLAAAVTWCRATLKIDTSKSALSRFLDWYQSNKWVDDCRKMADEFRDTLKVRPGFQEDGRAVMDAAQVYFETMVMKKRDPKLFLSLRKLKHQEQTLAFEREKFIQASCELFLKWYADEKARAIAESDAPNAKKIAQLRQTYFADVDELEKSGEVQIPS